MTTLGGVADTLRRAAVVRLIVMGVAMLAALLGVQLLHFLVFRKCLAPALDGVLTLAACAAAVGLYVLLVRLFERRAATELALGPAPRWAAFGAVIGAAAFSLVYALLAAIGVVAWGGFQGSAGVEPMLLMAIIAGVGEELIFRGVLFRVVEQALGSGLGIVVSATMFGLIHAFNHGATVVSSAAIALEAGVLLAAAYAWSRSLWLPIGLHAAWNFTEGGVFGAAVSGGAGKGLFAVDFSPTASPLLTGGAFGPEASLVAVAVSLVLSAAFLYAARRAGAWRPMRLRLMLD